MGRDRGFENLGRQRFEARGYLSRGDTRLGAADDFHPPVAALVETAVFAANDFFGADGHVKIDGAANFYAGEAGLDHA